MLLQTKLANLKNSFSPWSSYKPRQHQVFGCILISPQNKILTVKGRVSDKWSFPKGHIEANETTLQCALRELYEETGVSISPYNYHSYKQFKHPIHKKLNTAGYYIYYVSEEYPTHIFDIEEVSEAKWLSWNELCAVNGNIDISSFKRWQENMPRPLQLLAQNHVNPPNPNTT
jgi:8-oxo-dGTP pyrophosphatase MutT (NUDIX family)